MSFLLNFRFPWKQLGSQHFTRNWGKKKCFKAKKLTFFRYSEEFFFVSIKSAEDLFQNMNKPALYIGQSNCRVLKKDRRLVGSFVQ